MITQIKQEMTAKKMAQYWNTYAEVTIKNSDRGKQHQQREKQNTRNMKRETEEKQTVVYACL